MIILDQALRRRVQDGKMIRVGMVGCGFIGAAITRQFVNYSPGIELCAIANRTVSTAVKAFEDAGSGTPAVVDSSRALDDAIGRRLPAVTDDAGLLCRCSQLDAILEVTGTVEYASGVVLEAIDHGKHVLLMNTELDGTIGPWLKQEADSKGVIITNCDGDQPGVQMNLYRSVAGIGLRPLLCGNIKGLHDPYRTPETQAGFARRWGQSPSKVTSFADGTKISFEQAIVGNATGMGVMRRGMLGPAFDEGTPIVEAAQVFDTGSLELGPGMVDYVVGAAPAPGVFVLASCDDARQRQMLKLYKLGEGPLYCFYQPYHLCHFEVPNSVARAVLFHDAVVTPAGAPTIEVVATAKRDLKRGELLDGIGHFTTYGQCENISTSRAEGSLPMGLAEGCRLRRDVPRDTVLRYSDVDLSITAPHVELRARQDALYFESKQQANES